MLNHHRLVRHVLPYEASGRVSSVRVGKNACNLSGMVSTVFHQPQLEPGGQDPVETHTPMLEEKLRSEHCLAIAIPVGCLFDSG